MERATLPKYDKAAKTAGRAKALDTKECILEVQGILVGKLAAEENHFKGLTMLPGFCITDFEERAKEIGEVIQALQY